jgi:hypothetical protein
MQYYSLEPWGSEMENMTSANIAMHVTNLFRKKGDEPLKLKEFMMQFIPDKPPERRTAKEEYQAFKSFAIGLKRRKKDK